MRCVLALLLLGLLCVQIRAQAFLNNQPISLPGVIEVENFDLGGEGVGYHDNEPANLGGAYRTTEGVDIGDCFDVGQGYSIGWTRAGEWLQYTVTIAQTANYTITVRYASASCGGALHFELDSEPITPSVSVNTTGSWQVWSTLTLSTPQLAAKSFAKLRLYLDANGPAGSVANLNYIQFAAVPVAAPAVPASPYNLQREYAGASFFDRFNFFTAADPTHGYVTYVDRTTASNTGLARVTPSGQAFMGVDNTTVAWGAGRRSVRIESTDKYNSGLFILDVAHMPTGCGTWPAYWLVGPNWPYAGEIDIFEGVHTQSSTSTTLHTNAGCSMYGVDANSMTGAWITRNCDVNAAGQYSNQGCGINGKVGSFGAPFNAAGGGVSATLWDATGIRIWFWQRGSAPADIAAGAPQPDRWGNPYARFNFGGECPASHFKNHFIVFNTALCGDWAGGNFGGNCPGLGSCTSYVQNNPWAFTQAYWLVNSLRVYQKA